MLEAPSSSASAAVLSSLEVSARADSLARGISLALADAALRRQLRDDMRDSPYRRHALPLWAHLRGSRGEALSAKAAEALGLSVPDLLAFEQSLPAMTLVMERAVDRMQWTGTADVVVYGTAVRGRARVPVNGTLQGYNVSGRVVEVPLRSYAPFPYLAVVPAKLSLRPKKEGLPRTVAPSGETISTSAEEVQMLTFDECAESGDPYCCPETAIDCEGEPSPGPEQGGTLLPAGIDHRNCFGWTGLYPDVAPVTSANDADQDGIRDDCEWQIAYAFRPMLARNNSDEAPEREPYYSVTRSSFGEVGTVKIFYALSYYRDPGDPFFHMEAHDGDSEFIVVYVHNTADPRGTIWALDRATLSAHWGAGVNIDHTRTYSSHELEYPTEDRGRPRVWVSKNKHANYANKHDCDWVFNDHCDTTWDGTAYEDVEVMQFANIGNMFDTSPARTNGVLRDYVTSRTPPLFGNTGTERFWYDQSYFAGWHSRQGQAIAGSYRTALSFFKF